MYTALGGSVNEAVDGAVDGADTVLVVSVHAEKRSSVRIFQEQT